MKNSKANQGFLAHSFLYVGIVMLLLLSISAYSNDNGISVRFKPEYKIKRIPNVGVSIYTTSTADNEKEEFFFKDFNADVVLQIYRRISVEQITSNLAKQYHLSKDDSRRGVKRVIYTLTEWGMIAE